MASQTATWTSAAQIQAIVLWALMLRETRTRYGRMRMGYLWALIEPMIFVGIFFVLFTLGGRTALSNMPLMPFLITGRLDLHPLPRRDGDAHPDHLPARLVDGDRMRSSSAFLLSYPRGNLLTMLGKVTS